MSAQFSIKLEGLILRNMGLHDLNVDIWPGDKPHCLMDEQKDVESKEIVDKSLHWPKWS